MGILQEQNLYTHVADFSNDGVAGDAAHARTIDAWKKNLGHNQQVAAENHAAGFSGFTYAPHDLSAVMGGATPNGQRLGPQGQPIVSGGAEDEYGPAGFSRLSNREDGDNGPSRSLLGAFAQMLSLHGTGWNNEGMENTIAGSTTLRSARNRSIGVGGTPESSGGGQDLYNANSQYDLTDWHADEIPSDGLEEEDDYSAGGGDEDDDQDSIETTTTPATLQVGWPSPQVLVTRGTNNNETMFSQGAEAG